MNKLSRLEIRWNDDIDTNLSIATSEDKALETFFTMPGWDFIHQNFKEMWEENDCGHGSKAVEFYTGYVLIYNDEDTSKLDKIEFLRILYHLYDIMIVGANDDHHSVRYEPWWQEFTDIFYQMKCKIELNGQV